MNYSIEPAYLYQGELTRLIMKASCSLENRWFFADGCFSADVELEHGPNTWQNEKFVVIHKNQVIAYFDANWSKPLTIISNFRMIIFNRDKGFVVAKAIFDYFDYIFVIRGCRAFNWFVAEKNEHAKKVYEKFTSHYFGKVAGRRHYGQMSYNGEISDIILYEITDEDYFAWKKQKAMHSK